MQTARRRWSREFDSEIDGLAFGATGPILLHGYDPPAGGKWLDDVIPSKMGAFDRNDGSTLWVSPCEVGYGRGFGAGLGEEEDVVVLGPGNQGHRIVRMSVDSGEQIGAQDIAPFDHALVAGDMCVAVLPNKITGIMTSAMIEVWGFCRDGERYHFVTRDGEAVYVSYTDENSRKQGILSLDSDSGDSTGSLIEPVYGVIHDLVAGEGIVVLLTSGGMVTDDILAEEAGAGLMLTAISTRPGADSHTMWRQRLSGENPEDLPDVGISLDSGKLYLSRGATLDVVDAMSGRRLGQRTIPGLDERMNWSVFSGAGLLIEEKRASLFEIPD